MINIPTRLHAIVLIWGLVWLILALSAGYLAAHVFWPLTQQRKACLALEQSYLKQALCLKENRKILVRLSEKPNLCAPDHAYIAHAQSRLLMKDQIEQWADRKQLDIAEIVFEPESMLQEREGIALCRQRISVQFSVSHDRPVLEWVTQMEKQAMGILRVEKFFLTRKALDSSTLEGQVVCQWSFLKPL